MAATVVLQAVAEAGHARRAPGYRAAMEHAEVEIVAP
jgi:hypothetical protein